MDDRPREGMRDRKRVFWMTGRQGVPARPLPRGPWATNSRPLFTPLLSQSGPAALGRSRGETVHLVVHHSHNSEAKQWDETVVLALGGMGRLLRAHLTLIVTLDQGEAGTRWCSFSRG